jgi:hypothetical protein
MSKVIMCPNIEEDDTVSTRVALLISWVTPVYTSYDVHGVEPVKFDIVT